MPEIKKYVLLDEQRPTAPISIQVGKREKVRLRQIPSFSPYLKTSFMDKDGKSRTIRLKLITDTIFQDEQIAKGILANEKFSNAERDAVKFINGELVTSNPIVQKFLDAHPQNKAFTGHSIENLTPMFEHRDEKTVAKAEISEHRRKLKAANKIDSMNLKEAQDLLILINGSFYKAPSDLNEAQLDLIDILEERPDGVDLILKSEATEDDKVNILIGRLVNAGLVSFDAVPNKVVVKHGNEWKEIKDVPSEYDLKESQRVLVDHLTSEAGRPLLEDLENMWKAVSETPDDKKGAKGGQKPQ